MRDRRAWPVWVMAAYVITLLALPVDFGPSVGGVVLSASRIVLLVAIAFAIADWRGTLAAAGLLPVLVWIGAAAFLGSALVTAATIPSPDSWARYGSLVVEGIVVMLLVFRAALAPGGLRTLVIVTVTTTVVVSAVALVLAALGYHYDRILAEIVGSTPVPQIGTRFGFERQAGPFRASLYFGIWVAVVSSLLLPVLIRAARTQRRVAAAAWVVLLVAVIFLTLSRMATTAMFIMPGIYFLVRGRRRAGASFLGAALACAALFTVLSLDPAIMFPQPGGGEGSFAESNSMRLAAYGAAFEAVRERPLFGWGLLSGRIVLEAIIEGRSYVDSTYLQLLVEFGLVGSASFLLLVAAILRGSRRTWGSAGGLALGLAIVGYLGMSALASTLTSTQMHAAFFVLAGLFLAHASGDSEARDQLVLRAQPPPPL